MNGHDGKELVYGPAIGHRLEDREVAEVGIREHGFQSLQFLRNVVELSNDLEHLVADGPEELFSDCSKVDCQIAEIEEVEDFVHGLNGVVITLQQVFFGKVAVIGEQVR